MTSKAGEPFCMPRSYAHGLAVWTNAYAHPSFHRWACHGGCAYAYANFAQAVQISKFCTFEAATVHFFSPYAQDFSSDGLAFFTICANFPYAQPPMEMV